jgi:hypothetical protein
MLAKDVTVLCELTRIPWEDMRIVFLFVSMTTLLNWTGYIFEALMRVDGLEGDQMRGMMSTFAPVVSLFQLRRTLVNCNPESNMKAYIELMGEPSRVQIWHAFVSVLLYFTRRSRCSDPRDKIFANFGIARQVLAEGEAAPVTVSYIEPAKNLYVVLMSALLRHIPGFVSLSSVEAADPNGRQGLPSWCPDFSVSLRHTPFALLSSNKITYDCSGPEQRKAVNLQISHDVIITSGFMIDTVVRTVSFDGYAVGLPDPLALLGLCLEVDEYYRPTNQHRIEALWRTLLANMDPSNATELPHDSKFGHLFCRWILFILSRRFADREDAREYLDYARIYDELRTSPYHLPSLADILCVVGDNPLKNPDLVREFQTFHNTLDETSQSRCVVLSSGGFLALAFLTIHPGDEIWLLQGGLVPHVLRRRPDGRYTFMGDAYVHGLMHGEILDLPDFAEGNREVHIL